MLIKAFHTVNTISSSFRDTVYSATLFPLFSCLLLFHPLCCEDTDSLFKALPDQGTIKCLHYNFVFSIQASASLCPHKRMTYKEMNKFQ